MGDIWTIYKRSANDFIEINKKIKDAFGYEPEELIGKNVLTTKLLKINEKIDKKR